MIKVLETIIGQGTSTLEFDSLTELRDWMLEQGYGEYHPRIRHYTDDEITKELQVK